MWGIKTQLFWDENKRTSNLIANFILIQNGCGIITINEEYLNEFSWQLTLHYKNDKNCNLENFLYEKCIFGMNINFDLEKKYKSMKGRKVK